MNDSTESVTSMAGPIRWWIPGPGRDESLHSIVERAERLYGRQSDQLRQRLRRRPIPLTKTTEGLDALSARDLCLMARLIGVPPRSLFAHRMPDQPWLLCELERRAYCPYCWRDDRRAGRPRTFRRAWAGVFTLSCALHGVPLHWASPTISHDVLERVSKQPRRTTSKHILCLIDQLASVMSATLRGERTWPKSWRGDAWGARALLMRAVVNLGCAVEHPPFVNVKAAPDLAAFINTPQRRIEPLRESPWEAVRALGPPAWRRSALWVVACHVMPEMSLACRQEGWSANTFEVFDAPWMNWPSELRTLRRTRRYGAALRKMCRALSDLA